jgi:hypothetical protein
LAKELKYLAMNFFKILIVVLIPFLFVSCGDEIGGFKDEPGGVVVLEEELINPFLQILQMQTMVIKNLEQMVWL